MRQGIWTDVGAWFLLAMSLVGFSLALIPLRSFEHRVQRLSGTGSSASGGRENVPRLKDVKQSGRSQMLTRWQTDQAMAGSQQQQLQLAVDVELSSDIGQVVEHGFPTQVQLLTHLCRGLTA